MHIVCYLRQESKVFETYWTTSRGSTAQLTVGTYFARHGGGHFGDVAHLAGKVTTTLSEALKLGANVGVDGNSSET